VSRRQKILVVLVGVVFVLLYLLAMACQARSGTGGRDAGQSGPVAWLGGRLGGAAGADPADLTADCQQDDGRLVFDDTCVVEVAPSDRSLRLVTLHASHAIRLEAPAPAGDFTVDTEVEAGGVVRVAVGSDGAEIDLDCEDADECVVLIGDGEGARDG
jgi:hypothetical protein